MALTFLDTGVLIAAVRGSGEIQSRAEEILTDSSRTFASSSFVRIELLPKPIYFKQSAEVTFYREFFHHVVIWARINEELLISAYREAITVGASAMDALHLAAAKQVGAAEIVTTESIAKPIHRATGITVTTIQLDTRSR